MKKLLIATHNPGKIIEIGKFLSDMSLELISLTELKISEEPEETGNTYEENSQSKALFYSKLSGIAAVADDGGIEIEALGGAPGLKSNRWLGPDSSEEDIIEHMTKLAKDMSNRTSYFKTVVSLATPNGQVWSAKGQVEGIIAEKPFLKRSKGYPYRSFFYLPQLKKYYHEKDLSEKETKLYNHRYKAVQKLKPLIKKVLDLK